MTSHSLSWLLAVPAISAFVVLLLPRSWEGTIRRFAIGAMLVELLLSLRLIFADYSDAGYLFVEQISWVESFGISYKVGVDGLSLWLVILTTLLSPIALYASWGSIKTRIKEYAFSFLLLELGMLGAFVALDLFLFYVFWELMLVPMYLIIGVWGGKDRVYAAVKFFIYTMVGSLLMLVAILYLVTSYKELAGHYSFDLQELSTLVLP
ncbi:MAG: proton-conducting transporter membrane subunit, partial [Polyangiales bacterium]